MKSANNDTNCKGGKAVLLDGIGLRKVYNAGESPTIALKGVDIQIYQGELLVILGSSGSGKSTLLNMIGGMDKPTEGKIIVKGEDICTYNDKKLTKYRQQVVGFVFQSFNLMQELTAEENVALTAEYPDKAREMLKLVGLGSKCSKYPSQLSGGEQQRVSIARALAKKSEFLLCDEPTGALDYQSGKQILVELERLCREIGRTIVVVTHTKEIATMADRVIVMRSGEIIEQYVNEKPVSAETIEW